MNQDETIALFKSCIAARWRAFLDEGKSENEADKVAREVWNSWADSLLAEKKKLQETGRWRISKKYDPELGIHREFAENEVTDCWLKRARVDCSSLFFAAYQQVHDKGAIKSDNGQREVDHNLTKTVCLGTDLLIDFSGFHFPSLTLFSQTVFACYTAFRDATFFGNVYFNTATFSDYTSFDGARFLGDVTFEKTIFCNMACFNKTVFSEASSFSESTFCNSAQFHDAVFSGISLFHNTTFSGYAGFYSATFSGHTEFFCSTFKDYVDLSKATFNSRVEFTKSHVEHVFDLKDSIFNDNEPIFNQTSIKKKRVGKIDIIKYFFSFFTQS